MLLVRASARRDAPPPDGTLAAALPNDAGTAAMASMRATVRAGNPWSVNQLVTRFGLTRADATRVRELVAAETAPDPSDAAGVPLPHPPLVVPRPPQSAMNGHGNGEPS